MIIQQSAFLVLQIISRMRFVALLGASVVCFSLCKSANGEILLEADFSQFVDGNFVGQQGWQQLLAGADQPLQVISGQLVHPGIPIGTAGGSTLQSAIKNFNPVLAPVIGSTSLFLGLKLTVDSAEPGQSYFVAMSDVAGGFANARIGVDDLGAGRFGFGARVTGQGGYPYAVGGPLNFGTPYNLILQMEFVAGVSNDIVRLFVDPTDSDVANQTPYSVGTFNGVGTVNDPASLGTLIISQFVNAGTGQDGIRISSIRLADNFAEAAAIPEPSSLILVYTLIAGLITIRQKRSAQS